MVFNLQFGPAHWCKSPNLSISAWKMRVETIYEDEERETVVTYVLVHKVTKAIKQGRVTKTSY